jgi:YebC/PmpR family DNA-binding regulatory protein
MSGHSKWSTIKRKKGAADARRGQMFTKLGKEIEIAARDGGDPEFNFRLRVIIDKAKNANMPRDNIERAVRRGAGLEKGAAQLEEIVYEGYGPHGVALLISVLTDNRNRAVADIRRVFNRSAGNLGEAGCVAWLFDQKGYITVPTDGQDPDELALMAIDAGAEDVRVGDEEIEIYTAPEDLAKVRNALLAADIAIDTSELTMEPKSTITMDETSALRTLSIIEELEELEDVQVVFSNLDMSAELMSAFEAQ